jgi:hypothetical protein
MRQRMDAAMDHMADVIKDALLDGLEFSDDEDVPVAPLHPLSSEQFVEAMRPRVERALRQVADILNDALYESPAATEEATGEVFSELWLEALQVAAQARLAATLAEQPAEVPLPDGEWAKRYRRMHSESAD